METKMASFCNSTLLTVRNRALVSPARRRRESPGAV
jgi:hypothetical protein